MALDPDDQRPVYVQVADELRRSIMTGKLRAGQRLPSLRELAAEYDIAPMTVQSALRVLRGEGLIVSRQGTGIFVRDRSRPDSPAAGDGHSSEYQAVMQQLEAMHEDVRSLADRLARLEKQVNPGPPRSAKRAR